MKTNSTQRPLWVAIVAIMLAFLLASSSLGGPQIAETLAKYTTTLSAGIISLNIEAAHAILMAGPKLNAVLNGKDRDYNEKFTTISGNQYRYYTEIEENTSITEVIFGKTSDYASVIGNTEGVDVSEKKDGSIMLYRINGKAYILSDRTIATGSDFSNVFNNMTALTKVTFSEDFDTSRATNLAHLFYKDAALGSIENLNTFDTSNVTSMQATFHLTSNTALTSLDLSSFDTSKVVDMGSMFRGCAGLTTLDLSSFKTPKVWDMGGMFEGCSKLKTVDIRNFSSESVVISTVMFSGCSKLTSIYADYDFNLTYQATKLVQGASKTVTIYNGSSYDTKVNFEKMFEGCTNLVGGSGTAYTTQKDLKTVPKEEHDNTKDNTDHYMDNTYAVVDVSLAVEQVVFQSTKGYFTHYSGANPGSAYLKTGQNFNAAIKTLANGSTQAYTFQDTAIKKIVFGKTSIKNVSGLNSVNLDNANKGTIKGYWEPSTGTVYVLSDNTICFNSTSDYMFDNLREVTSIQFANISTAANRTMQRMFGYCLKLTDLDLSLFETQNIVDYGSCFHSCGFNINVANNNIIPHLDTSIARDIGGLFLNCTNLKGALDMSNLTSAKAETIASLVEGCSGITSINIRNFTVGSGLTNIGNMFNGCTALKTIYTNDKFNLNVTNVTLAGTVFTGCTSLVGGNGTKYSASQVGKTYARPDASGAPGYFTIYPLPNALALFSLAPMMLAHEPVVSESDVAPVVSDTDVPSDVITPVVSGSDATTTTVTTTTTTTTVTTTTTTTTAATTATTTATTAAETTAATSAVTTASADETTSTASETTTTAETTVSGEAVTTTTADAAVTTDTTAAADVTTTTTAAAATTAATTTTTAAVTTTTATTAATTTTTTAAPTTTTTTTAAPTTTTAAATTTTAQ